MSNNKNMAYINGLSQIQFRHDFGLFIASNNLKYINYKVAWEIRGGGGVSLPGFPVSNSLSMAFRKKI